MFTQEFIITKVLTNNHGEKCTAWDTYCQLADLLGFLFS